VALLTSTEAKAIKPDLSGTTQDALIDTLIGRADEYLAAYCGFPRSDTSSEPSLTTQTYTLYLDGPTWADSRVLSFPVFPIVTVTSIFDDVDRVYGAATEVASSDWELDIARGLVILKNASTQGLWTSSWRAQKVTATLGYTDASGHVPQILRHAGAELVWHWFRLMRERGQTSATINGAGGGLRDQEVPPYVLELAAPFRLPGSLL